MAEFYTKAMVRSLILAAFVVVMLGCSKQNGETYDSTATTNSTTNSYNSSNQTSRGGGATAPAPVTGGQTTTGVATGGPAPTDTTGRPPDTLHR